MKLPTVVLMDGDGRYVWEGPLTQLARDNDADIVRDIIAQYRASLAAHGTPEPALIGGGAAPHFNVLLSA